MVQMVVADGVEFVVGADQFCRGQLGAHTVEGSGELGVEVAEADRAHEPPMADPP